MGCCSSNAAQASRPRARRVLDDASGPKSKAGDSKYLEWRCPAIVPPPPPPAELTADVAQHGMEVMTDIVAHLATLGDKSPDLPTITSLMLAEADWSIFAHWQLARISAINSYPGPRVQVVWWGTMEKLGRIPKWPDDQGHILDAEELLKAYIANMDDKGKVDGRIACVSFFSHRWERPGMDPSFADPDTSDHKKAKAMWNYGRLGSCPVFMNHMWDVYFWVDFAGINQACPVQKSLGIAKLPGYVAACSEMIFYDSSTATYEPRAWTRVERMLSFFYTWAPLFVYLSDEYPVTPVGAEDLVKRAPQNFLEDPAAPGSVCMYVKDPLGTDAALTDLGDMEIIKKLVDACKGAVPFNPEMRGLSIGDFKFGSSYMRVDTEHGKIDVGKQAAEEDKDMFEQHPSYVSTASTDEITRSHTRNSWIMQKCTSINEKSESPRGEDDDTCIPMTGTMSYASNASGRGVEGAAFIS